MFHQGKGEKALAFCSLGKGKFAKSGQGNKVTQRALCNTEAVCPLLPQAGHPCSSRAPLQAPCTLHVPPCPLHNTLRHGGSLPRRHPPARAKAPERQHTARAITYKPSHPSARWCRQRLRGGLAPLLGSTRSRPTPPAPCKVCPGAPHSRHVSWGRSGGKKHPARSHRFGGY